MIWQDLYSKVAVSARLFFIHIMCGCCCVAYARFILKLDTLGGLLCCAGITVSFQRVYAPVRAPISLSETGLQKFIFVGKKVALI